MIVEFKVPKTSDKYEDYVNLPILNSEGNPIGVILSIKHCLDDVVTLKGEIWDRFVDVNYEMIDNRYNSFSIVTNNNN